MSDDVTHRDTERPEKPANQCDAAARDGQESTPPGSGKPATPREPFYWTIPDYVRADSHLLLPRVPIPTKKGGQSIAGGLRWLIHAAVVAQARATVVLPDVLFYQALWGGDPASWPANRRQDVLSMLRRGVRKGRRDLEAVEHIEVVRAVGGSDDAGTDGEAGAPGRQPPPCPARCPLRDSGRQHHHFRIRIRTLAPSSSWADFTDEDAADPLEGVFLGALDVFGDGNAGDRTYDWTLKPPPLGAKRAKSKEQDEVEDEVDDDDDGDRERFALIRSFQKGGALSAVYLPTLVFAYSPKVGLTVRRRLLHRAIMRELTRAAGNPKAGRADRAEVVIGGRGAGGGVAVYPGLQRGVGYIGFNGNGKGKRAKYHGSGYAVQTWMGRACVPLPKSQSSYWKAVRAFLRDLTAVADVFGMVVAAFHPKKQEWKALPLLAEETRSESGRKWVKAARLRIYTRADYSERWRAWLADKMGFSVIPRPGDEVTEQRGPHSSAAALRAYLSAAKVSQASFAAAIGASKSEVSKRFTASLKWSRKWADRVKECLKDHPEWAERVSKNSG